MGLFNFLKLKRSEIPLALFAEALTLDEKVAVYLTMLLVVTQQGGRKCHLEEERYIETVKQFVLCLTDDIISTMDIVSFNIISKIDSMSNSHKKYFALVFYELAIIEHDPSVIYRTSVIINSMGFTMEELAKKQAQDQYGIDNNRYLTSWFSARK